MKQLLIIQAPCTIADIYHMKTMFSGEIPNICGWEVLSNQFKEIKDDYTVIILVKDKNANNAYDWEYHVVGNERGILRW